MNKKIVSIILLSLSILCVGCTDAETQILEKTEPIQKVDKESPHRAYQETQDRENATLQKEIAYKYRDKDIKATIEYDISIGEDTENSTVSEPDDIVLWGFPDNAEQNGTYDAYFTDKSQYIYIRQYLGNSTTTTDYQVYLDEATYNYVTEYIKYIDEYNIVDYEKVGDLINVLITTNTEQIKDWVETNAPIVFKSNYAYQSYEIQDLYKG